VSRIPRPARALEHPGAHIGRPVPRVDGRAKVTGAARYAAEVAVPGLLHGHVVSSAITRGRITAIDTAAAMALPGVVHVFTHQNRPRTAWFDRKWKDLDAPAGSPFRPLHDETISHDLQPVALVVAESFEAARAGARLVAVTYAAEPHRTDLRAHRHDTYEPGREKLGAAPPPKPRGDADRALREAEVAIDVEYSQAAHHHNPLELFASTVIVEDDGTLTIHDKTQGVLNSRNYVCNVFGLDEEKVRVLSPFVGGAFGAALRPQHQLFLAVMAALQLQRSVRVELSRPQMFSFGHRPETLQRVALGAGRDGALTALIHEAVQESSQFENYVENVVSWSSQQYRCDNVRLGYRLARLDVFTPLDMRAPGAATGVPAIECAIDELSYALGMDPIELRLRNYTERDPNHDKPFSSKELRACFAQGAERFGWSRRPPAPRATREGRELVGTGMAAGVWDALQGIASARALFTLDGKLTVSSATADIGTGTYTVMTQIAADLLGLAMEDVAFKLGDSSLPFSPFEGGSWTVATVGSAVKLACDQVAKALLGLAHKVSDGPLARAGRDDVHFADGHLVLTADPTQRVALVELLRRTGTRTIDETATATPYPVQMAKHTFATHSAVFAEVAVDDELGRVRVRRVVSAIAAGRIINPRTARSQIMGAIVGGIGTALEEERMVDHRSGRCVNHDLAEYHVPVNADVGAIDVLFVDEHDEAVNALGAKGVGEIGIIGVSAAIANAIYHATGKRVRDFPITVDKLL
jgi:xanthine dehydrogenase YagR molybdenum-binding subunit